MDGSKQTVVLISLLNEEEALQMEQAVQLQIASNSRQLLSSAAVGIGLQESEKEVRETHVRMQLYYSDVCCRKSDADFKSDYRVDRTTFGMLCQLVASSSEFMPSQTGNIAQVAL